MSRTSTANRQGSLRKTGASAPAVQGAAADDAAAVGNPILIGGKYEATPNTVEDGDASTLKTDANGRLLVQSQGNIASDVADVGNPVKVGGVVQSTLATQTAGRRLDLPLSTRGRLFAAVGSIALPADGVANGNIMGLSTWDDAITGARAILTAPMKFNGTTWDRDRKSNGTSRIPSAAADTNATVAKASAGDLHTVHGYNAAASVRYLKFYNKATAPTVGTDVPVMTLALPPTSVFRHEFDGHYFSAGIAYAMTTGAADADTAALTAADVLGLTVTYA